MDRVEIIRLAAEDPGLEDMLARFAEKHDASFTQAAALVADLCDIGDLSITPDITCEHAKSSPKMYVTCRFYGEESEPITVRDCFPTENRTEAREAFCKAHGNCLKRFRHSYLVCTKGE